jgi:hypothetical protein
MAEIYREHSMKTIQTGRVSRRNFLPKFRIALLPAAAPDERAKWPPPLPKTFLIFCLQFLGRLFTLTKN